jgi:hypothetical protein
MSTITPGCLICDLLQSVVTEYRHAMTDRVATRSWLNRFPIKPNGQTREIEHRAQALERDVQTLRMHPHQRTT